MSSEVLGIVLQFLVTVLLAWPLGIYIARVYAGQKTPLDFFAPLERLFFRISGINPNREMTWQENLVALLSINFLWFFCFAYGLHTNC